MLKEIWRLLITQTYWRFRFGSIGWRTVIFKPMLINSPSKIFIGSYSQIRDYSRIEIINRPHMGWTPILKIGNNVNIEQNVHIVCQCEVIIEDNVSITPFCVIVDTYHPHDCPNLGVKIGSRLPNERTHVRIGMGSFIGAHSVVLPNIRIGKYCVIGAGSVVTTDIPDFSIAKGSPARVISTYDLNSKKKKEIL